MIMRSCDVETKSSDVPWCCGGALSWMAHGLVALVFCSCGAVLTCPVVAFHWWVCALCLVCAMLFFYP